MFGNKNSNVAFKNCKHYGDDAAHKPDLFNENGQPFGEMGMCSGFGFEDFDKYDRDKNFPATYDVVASIRTARRKHCKFTCAQASDTYLTPI